ncbi:MAG: DNA mismatch repair protein MutS [bacterium]
MSGYTPMMLQYLDIKKNYKDCLLFFRLGDFYEMFFEDALLAVDALGITLTSKNCGKKDGEQLKVDMCGVPFSSSETYISKLVKKGYKVAICDQIEDAKDAVGKVVQRDVVRIVTSGTLIDTNVLEESQNNYIMCLFENKAGFGLAVCDVSTGEFLTMEFTLLSKYKLIDEIAKYNPSEIICNADFSIVKEIERIFNKRLYVCLDFYFTIENATQILKNHFNTKSLSGFGIDKDPLIICVSGGLLRYLCDTQKISLSHISNIKKYTNSHFMAIDISSRRNLELTETIREKSKKGSLLWVLDKTNTPMGGRLIRKWIEQPLIQKKEINRRLDSVSILLSDPLEKASLISLLSQIRDIERLLTKISYQTVNARDLNTLKVSFLNLPDIKKCLENLESLRKSKGLEENLLTEILAEYDDLSDLYNLLNTTIADEPPISIRDGAIIKECFNELVDKYRNAKKDGGTWLKELEQRERKKTGIKNLKVKNNKIFGQYIEVGNLYVELVPDYFIRRQTTSNGERYITDELKEIEDTILNADEKLVELEYEIFCNLRVNIFESIPRIQKVASLIAILDVICSFSIVAEKNKYSKPILKDIDKNDDNAEIIINMGRHPVVELLIEDIFIPNDTILDKNKNRLAVITGPNMAGKSTYMRQVALIVLMAQIGCYVPCNSANISIVDKIFTRVGASDDLATGQSTFMIEMSEVANILNTATSNSLLILDEIGRGTSTYDGLSIAWAVLEYIANKSILGSRTLFATHYHELTEIEEKIQGVNNYCVEVKNTGKDIIFLRKIIKGIAVSSYGLYVAKLAGIPPSVLERADVVLKVLDEKDYNKSKNSDSDSRYDACYNNDLDDKKSLFIEGLEEELKNFDINNTTPLDAWKKLSDIKSKLDNL